MQAFKVILLLVCLAGVASAVSWTDKFCEQCKEEVQQKKGNLPQVEIDSMARCKQIPDTEAQAQCVSETNELIEKLSKETPLQICQYLKICSRVS